METYSELRDSVLKSFYRHQPAKTKRVEAMWKEYEHWVLPKQASAVQRSETRRAFYAGCYGLLTELMTMLDPGTEAIDTDLIKMTEIDNELKKFNQDVKDGRA